MAVFSHGDGVNSAAFALGDEELRQALTETHAKLEVCWSGPLSHQLLSNQATYIKKQYQIY